MQNAAPQFMRSASAAAVFTRRDRIAVPPGLPDDCVSLRRLLATLSAQMPDLPRIEPWIDSDELRGAPDLLHDLMRHTLCMARRAQGDRPGPIWLMSDGGPPQLRITLSIGRNRGIADPLNPVFAHDQGPAGTAARIDLRLAQRMAARCGGRFILLPAGIAPGAWARLSLPGNPGRADLG